MTTFKQFMVEAEGEKLAVAMAQKMLNGMVDELPHIPEQISQGAKHHGHKFVDTVSGPWIVTHYKNGENEYVKVEPPKGSSKHPMFFIPRGTPNMSEGAVKDALHKMVEKAIARRKEIGMMPNYQLALTQIAHELQKIDNHSLTKGMTYKQLRDQVRPFYDESDHAANKESYIK